MIWFFVRGNEHLKCEVRESEGGYELSLDRPDRSRSVHTFDTPAELLARFSAFPHALKLDGWRLPPIWREAVEEARPERSRDCRSRDRDRDGGDRPPRVRQPSMMQV